jgi:hypothetical protein
MVFPLLLLLAPAVKVVTAKVVAAKVVAAHAVAAHSTAATVTAVTVGGTGVVSQGVALHSCYKKEEGDALMREATAIFFDKVSAATADIEAFNDSVDQFIAKIEQLSDHILRDFNDILSHLPIDEATLESAQTLRRSDLQPPSPVQLKMALPVALLEGIHEAFDSQTSRYQIVHAIQHINDSSAELNKLMLIVGGKVLKGYMTWVQSNIAQASANYTFHTEAKKYAAECDCLADDFVVSIDSDIGKNTGVIRAIEQQVDRYFHSALDIPSGSSWEMLTDKQRNTLENVYYIAHHYPQRAEAFKIQLAD